MGLFEEIAHNVQEGYADRVRAGIEQGLSEGLSPHDLLHKGLIAGMDVVAQKFKSGQMFLPEVLAVASAMKAGLGVVQPHLDKADSKPLGKIVIGTVRGDMHDIGKNLVVIMLQGAGFQVVDLGTDVRADKFVAAVKEEKPDVVGMSALLTTTMVHMRGVIEALETNNLRDTVKVIVGGAPISSKYAADIKADGYARDAATAVDLVRTFVSGKA